MTQPNSLQTKEKSPSDAQFQRKFWGVVAISLLASLAYSYVLLNLFKLEPTIAVYIKMAVYVIAIALSVTSFILAIRRQVDLALTTIFYYLLIALVAGPATTQGRTLNSTFTMLVVGIVMIRWLLPQSSWRRNAVYLAGAFALAWGFEWINPPWRIVTAAATIGPTVAIIFSVILVILLAREAWGRSMRNKLLVALIGVTLVAIGILAAYVFINTNNILDQGLERELAQRIDGISTQVGGLINEQINTLTTLSLNEVLEQAVEESNQSYEGSPAAIQAELDKRDAQWQAADKADNNNDPLVREHLNNDAAQELLEYQGAFPNNIEVFITDVYGGLTTATERTSDYYQADEAWWQAAYNDGQGAVYISDPEFDESAGALAVLIAMPLRNRETGEISGILRTTYVVSAFESIVGESIGETGKTELFIPGETVYHLHEGEYVPAEEGVFEALQTAVGQGKVEMEYEGTPSIVVQAPVHSQNGNPYVDNLGWVVVFHQNQDEAFAPLNVQVRGMLVVMVIVLILAVAAALGLALFLVRPIVKLTRTAEEVAAGDLSSRAEVTTTDEIGTLASTFNSMTSQLQDTLQGLEERVADRTKDLATVAKVSTATATIRDPEKMLANMVHLTQRGFDLYHAHVFTYRPESEELQIVACGYKEGDEHEGTHGTTSIPLAREQSLVARAARTRQPVIVNDVRSDPGWLPNPLLPETRAELAVPMIVGDELLGVLDVQSEQVDAFTEEDANIQMTLASQIATALQNAQAYTKAQKQAELETLVNVIGQRIQRTTSIEDTLQTAIRELGTYIGASRVKVNIRSASGVAQTEPVTYTQAPVVDVERSNGSSDSEDTLAS